MIKKFGEFIKEATYFDISSILSEEELEDQFLRLKEILNCDVHFFFEDWSKSVRELKDSKSYNFGTYIVRINYGKNDKLQYPRTAVIAENIKNEIDQIKRRLEIMYNLKISVYETYSFTNMEAKKSQGGYNNRYMHRLCSNINQIDYIVLIKEF